MGLDDDGGLEGVDGSPNLAGIGVAGKMGGAIGLGLDDEVGFSDEKTESENAGGRKFDVTLDAFDSFCRPLETGLRTKSLSRDISGGLLILAFDGGLDGVAIAGPCRSSSRTAKPDGLTALGVVEDLAKPSAPDNRRRRFVGRNSSIQLYGFV